MSTAASPRPSSTPSRLAPARRRARLLKIASAGAAVAGFGVLSLLVRGCADNGNGASTQTPTSAGGALELSSRISQEAEDSGSFFGSGSSSGSVSPNESSAPPQASTHTS